MPFNRIKQALDRRMIVSLTEEANRIAEKARQNADWSDRIPQAIGVSEAKKTSKGYEVSVTVDLKVAPHAAAFEYGSGEHGEKGETYEIAPKEKAVLAFPWTPEKIPWRSHKFAGIGRDDKFLFYWVDHPGVEAKPYLKPAIDENRNNILNRIRRTFRDAYREGVVRVEVISAEK